MTGNKPEFSTSGGTSMHVSSKTIARWSSWASAGATMHKVDECMAVTEIHRLTDIYEAILESYFANPVQ